MTDHYASLRRVLDAAYRQSAEGKGVQRHGNGLPFDRQPIMENARRFGPGSPLGQASKKVEEAYNMHLRGEHEAAINELLGAIVYSCAAVIAIGEIAEKQQALAASAAAGVTPVIHQGGEPAPLPADFEPLAWQTHHDETV
jgi:hypothetical protein